ncbi:MAG: hypothetical protein ACE5FF_06925 [Saprospiraceae bacterium]
MKNLRIVFVNRCKLNQMLLHLKGPAGFQFRLGRLRQTLKLSLAGWQRHQVGGTLEGARVVKMNNAGFYPQLLRPFAHR